MVTRLNTDFRTDPGMNLCTICLENVIPIKINEPGPKYKIAKIHSSDKISCYVHESCIRSWAGQYGTSSNACPKCMRQISDVTFYKPSVNHQYVQVARKPLAQYTPPPPSLPPAPMNRFYSGAFLFVLLLNAGIKLSFSLRKEI
jgi:hypothetical protein